MVNTFIPASLYHLVFKIASSDIVKIGVFAKITIDEHEICLTSTDADFQFKKMALLSLCFSVNNISALSVIKRSQWCAR